ncbi:hypothetical protein GQ42DRAFT_159872 [Ramicandelaber brevisporus]|nr:hypothetical protein GQ42DRAFT_159872 [Ramicandelaber brevisporus]
MSELRLVPAAIPASASGALSAAAIAATAHPETGAHDALRFGLKTSTDDAVVGHPLEARIAGWDATQFEMKMAMQRRIAGLHAPLRLTTERAHLMSRQLRPGLLKRHNLSLDIVMGTDEDIDVTDVFSDSKAVVAPSVGAAFDVHTALDRQFNLKW